MPKTYYFSPLTDKILIIFKFDFYSKRKAEIFSSIFRAFLIFNFSFFSLSISAKNVPELEHLVNVRAIAQDTKGFIWFSNSQGLTRFDGKKIITFSSNNKLWTIPFSHPQDMSVVDEMLLLSTENNRLWVFDPFQGSASAINIKTESPTIYHAVKFKENYYAFSKAPDNLYRYNPNTLQTTTLQENVKLSKFLQTEKHLYYASKNNLFEIKEDKIVKSLTLEINAISAISAISNGVIIATRDKLYFLADNGQLTYIDINNSITAIAAENKAFNSTGSNFLTIDANNVC